LLRYIHVEDLRLGPLHLHPFGLLVASGVLAGSWLATRRARYLGLSTDELHSFVTWMLIGGFTGGHVFDSLLYHPADVLARPWSLLFLWEGLSSFGGFAGALIGVLIWRLVERRPITSAATPLAVRGWRRRSRPVPILPYCDAVLAVFPVAWVFGRAGCAVVHDHPGARASERSVLAVAYGPGPSQAYGLFELHHGNAPRYDLGLLEMLFAVVLAIAFAVTWRRRFVVGTYVAAACLAYAPVRFGLDFLRIEDVDGADPRYLGLTPAQWACIALFAFGLALARSIMRPASPRHAAAGPRVGEQRDGQT
jgi:phosphatidylglycerol:prolipoprotein diacylglycerol transferase